MMTSFFAGLLLAYAGMAALCLGMERHFKQVWQHLPSPGQRQALRLAGWALLAGSFAACVLAWGWAMGPVGWLGQVSLGGFLLLMLLPYWPRLAVLLPVFAAPWLGLVGVIQG
ncbi:Protein of unknown function [Pseudomonas cuatrocienegasensis]|uniref:Iron uptake protein n=1 Tax=Pseudomonas cuatrocienegasensis TaxID=543360 RepID=A0ABY1BRG2_9PSED|nr:MULTISPECIES: DUF3325 domain-containing protein [Pseudomonas]OEC32745.1 iron uptake protein [Pseudomonas sp. 21C1]SER45414.1 Protein of unknown function [Pseudomonas cuatrocienegasensis]